MNLNHISSESIIADPIRKDNAWKIISDFPRFPQLSKNIDKILVTGKSGMEQMSEWDVTFDGAPLTWIQKDILDRANFTANFKAVSGDFEHYSGSLHVEDAWDGGMAVVYELSYKVGIPIIEDLFGPVFKKKMQENFKAIVIGIAGEIGKHKVSVDERASRRYKIGIYEGIIFDGQTVQVKIEDLSCGGMMFSCENELEKPVSVQVCGLDVRAQELNHEFFDKKYRLVFEKEIEERPLLAAVKLLQSRHIKTRGKLFAMEPRTAVYS